MKESGEENEKDKELALGSIHLHPKSPNHLSFPAKLVSGAVAGVIGTSIIFPLDFVKTRLQNNPSLTVQNVVQTAWRGGYSKGAPAGLANFYRGLAPNLIGVTPEKAIKLAVNDTMREFLARRVEGHGDPHRISPFHGMLAGALAGLFQVIATNPMEIVKIQMQMGGAGTRISDVVQRLGGLKGLYRGTMATLCRDIPFSILFFQSSASLRSLFGSWQGAKSPGSESIEAVFAAGVIAGSVAAVAVTPMDVVKTRLQTLDHNQQGHHNQGQKTGLWQVYKGIYEKEGPRAFFRGALQRCFIVSPLFGITLLVYELQKSLLLPSTSSASSPSPPQK